MVRLEYKLPGSEEWLLHGIHPAAVAAGYAERLKFSDPNIETRLTEED